MADGKPKTFDVIFEGVGRASGKMRNDIHVDWPAQGESFELATDKGEPVRLDDFKGRRVIVYFYPKADTPGCTKQSCSVRDAREDLKKDGVDAVSILAEEVPDLMLLDIEMPRMDGFEVASYVRNDDRLKDIPIIMITSRTGSKHRDKAMSIGVNEYLGKPYQEDDLVSNINKILHTSY